VGPPYYGDWYLSPPRPPLNQQKYGAASRLFDSGGGVGGLNTNPGSTVGPPAKIYRVLKKRGHTNGSVILAFLGLPVTGDRAGRAGGGIYPLIYGFSHNCSEQ